MVAFGFFRNDRWQISSFRSFPGACEMSFERGEKTAEKTESSAESHPHTKPPQQIPVLFLRHRN
jgi:hypothetical protein